MSKADREGVEIDSDASSEMDLDNFKKGVEFPIAKLQELVYNDSTNKLMQGNSPPPLSALSAKLSRK